jgi:hypothetical protein
VKPNNDLKYLPTLDPAEKDELQKSFKAAVQKTVAENIGKMKLVPNRPQAMEYFDQVSDFFGQREKEIREFKARGGKVIGFACMLAPVELILAAGAIPVRIDSGF